MKYVVQKMPQRSVTHLQEQIPNLIIAENPHVTPNEAFKLSLIEEDHVHLEDDAILCKDFRKRIEHAIAHFPGKMISFFTMKNIQMINPKAPGALFCMAQCVYFPWYIARDLRSFEYKDPSGNGIDDMIAMYLRRNRLTYVLWHPCLVQHSTNTSLIDPKRSTKRQTECFIDG